MVKNKRDLAVALSNNGKVYMSDVSWKLNRIVDLWISTNSIKKSGICLVGNF